jgi:hypothetical protein
MNDTFYEAVKYLVKENPNNMILGEKIRDTINRFESLENLDREVIKEDINQVTILEDIEKYGNRS